MARIINMEDYKNQTNDYIISISKDYGFDLADKTIDNIPSKYCHATVIYAMWHVCLDHLQMMEFPEELLKQSIKDSKEFINKIKEEG